MLTVWVLKVYDVTACDGDGDGEMVTVTASGEGEGKERTSRTLSFPPSCQYSIMYVGA